MNDTIKNFEVMIFDLGALPNEVWEKLWKEKKIYWIGKFKNFDESFDKITKELDRVQDEELYETTNS